MKKNDEKLKHALHNEKACNYLELKDEFSDWIITTAFYSALQFVSYKIFPLTLSAPNSTTTIVDNIDQYYNYYSNKNKNKHTMLKELVSKSCSEISPDYNWLHDMASTARYRNYQSDRLIANKAVSLMKIIKKHCV